MFTILKLLSLFTAHRAQPEAVADAETELLADTAEDAADERPAACGWFDSSHDLAHGLVVREHASPAAVANELPLAGWLELQLSAWRVAPAA